MKSLQQVTILDFSQGVAGPLATLLLADMGARVIKVEPPQGDWARKLYPPIVGSDSSAFYFIARNKESICIDLRKEEGQAVVDDLLRRADVIVHNYPQDVCQRFHLAFERCKEVNPAIVYVSVTGFPQQGAYAALKAVDPLLQAMSGLMAMTGEEGRSPVRVPIAVADVLGGMVACQTILLALLEKKVPGCEAESQRAEVNLFDSLLFAMAPELTSYLNGANLPQRVGSATERSCPSQLFCDADGEYFLVAVTDQAWLRFCRSIGMEELSEESRFQTNHARLKNKDHLIPLLEQRFAQGKRDEWIDKLRQSGIVAGKLLDFADVVKDQVLGHKKNIVSLLQPGVGEIPMFGSPLRFDGVEPQLQPAPSLGEHSQIILQELGYRTDWIASLFAQSIVYGRG